MDDKKKEAGPERVGSWKTASPTGVSAGDRSDGTSPAGFIAGGRWASEEEFEEEVDAATMDGGANPTHGAQADALPDEDEVTGAERTAEFSKPAWRAGEAATQDRGGWSPNSSQDASVAEAATDEISSGEFSTEGFSIGERLREGSGPDRQFSASDARFLKKDIGQGSSDESEGRTDDMKQKASEASDRVSQKASEASDRVAEKASQASDRVSQKASEASDRVAEKASEASSRLSDMGQKASGKAKSQFNQRKGDLADRLEGLRGEFDERANSQTEEWVGMVSERADEILERAARTLRERDADELLEQARSRIRQRPLVYAGGMLALGFLGARLLRAMEGGHATSS